MFSNSSKDIFQKSFKNPHTFFGKRSLPKIFLRSFENLASFRGIGVLLDICGVWGFLGVILCKKV